MVIAIAASFALAPAGADVGMANADSDVDSATEVVETKFAMKVYSKPSWAELYTRGRVEGKARFEVLEHAKGKGCKGGWLRIGPEAWICSVYTKETTKAPTTSVEPQIPEGELLPDEYVMGKKATAYESLSDAVKKKDGTKIKLAGFVRGRKQTKGGKRYMKTAAGWVATSQLQKVKPSNFKGLELKPGDEDKRLAFIKTASASVYDAKGKRIEKGVYTRQDFLGEVGEAVKIKRKYYYEIEEGRYLWAGTVTVVNFAEPPDDVDVDAGERWIDINLKKQTLIAYEGAQPIRVTLVSTAGSKWTNPGEWRIQNKRPTARLQSLPNRMNTFDLETPWMMTLIGYIAMHGTYWHDEFGIEKSHGCVNMSPLDARWVWEFTEPTLPAGWLRIDSTDAHPGTMVRIRSK
jgi:lipoprotein-anchoring transpeptidase ErfK/SrfK